MNKLILVSFCFLMAAPTVLWSQEGELAPYRRSSLYTILVDDNGFPNAEVIKETFEETPLPEKFNDHNLIERLMDPKKYTVNDKERSEAGIKTSKQGGFGSAMKGLGKGLLSAAAASNSGSSSGYSSSSSNTPKTAGSTTTPPDNTKDLPVIFDKYFTEHHTAREMVAKWYDMQEDGSFSTDLIAERGLYDASVMQAEIAARSARGRAMLKDAGQDLIGNTFVVGIRFRYVDKAEIAASANAVAGLAADLLGGSAGAITQTATQAAGAVAGRGYVVKSTAFLYQLVWDEETQAIFDTEHWNNPEAFMESDAYKLKYVGSEVAWADVQSSGFSKKTEDELIARATVRSIDAVISKLQRKYEPFRTKTPLATTEPEITAKIGLKEGLEAGDKFEVLEQVFDPATEQTKYVRKGVITVERNKIWDNRYNAGEEREEAEATEGESNENPQENGEIRETVPPVEATSFSGNNKGIYPGMLIRQIN